MNNHLDATLAGPLAGFIALLAGLVVGGLLVPVQGTVGLENIAMLYMAIVCVAAAVGGGLGGAIAGISAALCYNFFFTPPHLLLRIDSPSQAVTVVLLLIAGPATAAAANLTRGERRDSTSTALPYWQVDAEPRRTIPRSNASNGNGRQPTAPEPRDGRRSDP